MKDVNSWVDGAINAKVAPGEAVTSWWTQPRTRAQFDQDVAANQRRMSRSRFGRQSLRSSEQGFGDSQA